MEQQQQTTTGGSSAPIVVLAADNSKHSDFAFRYYAENVHRPEYVLHIVHCRERWHVHPMDGGPSPGHAKELTAKDEQDVEAMKNKYHQLMKDSQIKGEFHVIHSHHAWHEIVNYQEQVGGSMIVIGSRGLGALRRTMMGSVSDSVVHHAQCPVLVCRHT